MIKIIKLLKTEKTREGYHQKRQKLKLMRAKMFDVLLQKGSKGL